MFGSKPEISPNKHAELQRNKSTCKLDETEIIDLEQA